MSNQPNDYFLEPLWSLEGSLARLWSPEPRSANVSSAAGNRRPSSAPPILRTPSSANRAVDAGPTVASETPDNPAAHQVTIGHDQVKHHIEETEDRSRNVTPSVYPPTSTTYPSNLPLASADNDSHMLKHQSANIGTTNTDISTTVSLDGKISPAFSTVGNAEMVVTGEAGGPSHKTVQPLQQPFPILFNGSYNLPTVDTRSKPSEYLTNAVVGVINNFDKEVQNVNAGNNYGLLIQNVNNQGM